MDLELIERARRAAAEIAPLLASVETERKLPDAAVATLAAAGAFKLLVPRVYGGSQTDPATLISVIEAIAQVDGSAGWCVMVGATSGLMSLYLDEALAREVFGAADAIACGVFAPMGRAVPAPGGGYRVTGRWPFASLCEHARWRMGGTFVVGDPPDHDVRSVLFRADETRIIDTWDTAGLRGTGSHDLEVSDVLVPEARTFSMVRDRPRHDSALPFFGVLAASVAAVGLGIARTALDSIIALARDKRLPAGKKTLAQREVVQLEVARAEARLRAARSLLFDAIAGAVNETTIATRAQLRLAACHAATECAAVTASAYELGGGAAIYTRNPLQRLFRDAHVVTHHAMVSSTALTTAGRILLGVETDTSTL